jgi:hypothetical protein
LTPASSLQPSEDHRSAAKMLKTPQYVLNNQGDEDREKAHINKYKNFATQQRRTKHGIYLQQEPTFY